jgi:hypothetical protein
MVDYVAYVELALSEHKGYTIRDCYRWVDGHLSSPFASLKAFERYRERLYHNEYLCRQLSLRKMEIWAEWRDRQPDGVIDERALLARQDMRVVEWPRIVRTSAVKRRQ